MLQLQQVGMLSNWQFSCCMMYESDTLLLHVHLQGPGCQSAGSSLRVLGGATYGRRHNLKAQLNRDFMACVARIDADIRHESGF